VSFKEIVLETASISKSQRKRLDGFSKNAERIRAFLIGQIGKNQALENNPITLDHILDEIYLIIHDARELIGGRVIILECENEPSLIELYEKHGFKLLATEETPESELKTMYIHIA
jgi:hypothetical protein